MRKIVRHLAILLLLGWSSIAQDLQRPLQALIQNRHLQGASVGVVVEDLFSNRTLLAHNPDRPVIPASNMKLVAVLAALEFLGPDHAFTTRMRIRGEVKDGVVHGDLILEGDGDPFFGRGNPGANPGTWAGRVKALGIRKITGNLVIFEKDLDQEYANPDWTHYNAASLTLKEVAAIGNGENTVAIHLGPGAGVGTRALLRVVPACGHVELMNRTRTVLKKESGPGFTRAWGSNRIEVRGRVRLKGKTRSGAAAIHDPPLYLGRCMVRALKKAGVQGGGRIVRESGRTSPAGRVIATHTTPIKRMIRACLNRSDNRITEILFKAAGAAHTGKAGSFESGALAGAAIVKRSGARIESAVFRDGSGLSRMNRLTPRQLTTVLRWATDRPYAAAFTHALAHGGERGSTLRNRFKQASIANRIRAKTGYLNGVRALSGYLRMGEDRVWVFSLLVNGQHKKVQASRSAIDRFLATLARRAP